VAGPCRTIGVDVRGHGSYTEFVAYRQRRWIAVEQILTLTPKDGSSEKRDEPSGIGRENGGIQSGPVKDIKGAPFTQLPVHRSTQTRISQPAYGVFL